MEHLCLDNVMTLVVKSTTYTSNMSSVCPNVGWFDMATQERQLKSEKFDLRMRAAELQLIREAAKIKHVEPTAFIRQQAVAAAEAVVHEQQRFVLTADQWKAVNEAFEAPAKVLPNLANIMAEPDEWDDED